VLRTSFRSAIQATDSTCRGWTPKIAATNRLAPGREVQSREEHEDQHRVREMQDHVHDVGTAWSRAEHRDIGQMCESHVTGCQYGEYAVVSAHHAVEGVRP